MKSFGSLCMQIPFICPFISKQLMSFNHDLVSAGQIAAADEVKRSHLQPDPQAGLILTHHSLVSGTVQ